MKPLSADTPLDVERIWLDGIRERGPLFQLQRMLELTDLCRLAAREAIRRAHPAASPAERDEILLRELYGGAAAAREVGARRRELGVYDRQP